MLRTQTFEMFSKTKSFWNPEKSRIFKWFDRNHKKGFHFVQSLKIRALSPVVKTSRSRREDRQFNSGRAQFFTQIDFCNSSIFDFVGFIF